MLPEEMRALYEQVILDHNRNPRNYPKNPPGATHHAHGYNPLCGDEFTLHLRVENGVIADVGFEGAGCAISTASASLLTEAVKGKRLEDVRTLFSGVRHLLTGEGAPAAVGKLEILTGVHEFPMRVKCATLPWHTLIAALENRPDIVSTEDPTPQCAQPHHG